MYNETLTIRTRVTITIYDCYLKQHEKKFQCSHESHFIYKKQLCKTITNTITVIIRNFTHMAAIIITLRQSRKQQIYISLCVFTNNLIIICI